jgi:hypothetical protein
MLSRLSLESGVNFVAIHLVLRLLSPEDVHETRHPWNDGRMGRMLKWGVELDDLRKCKRHLIATPVHEIILTDLLSARGS